MRKFLNVFVLLFFLASSSTVYSVTKDGSQGDDKYDQMIVDFFSSEEFVKSSFNFPWEGKKYKVRAVCNPERKPLMGAHLSSLVYWPCAMTIDKSSYPLELVSHLVSLIPEVLSSDPESMLDMAYDFDYERAHHISTYNSVEPVQATERIDDPEVIASFEEMFASTTLRSKEVYYDLDGELYQVLIIHNPEGITLEAKKKFNTKECGDLTRAVTWNKKLGIFIDRPAPQEVIDSISEIIAYSWWDDFWNVTIYNGDTVNVYSQPTSYYYKFSPFTWFELMEEAKPQAE